MGPCAGTAKNLECYPNIKCNLPFSYTEIRKGVKPHLIFPITLCNIVYKIISKVISLCLKPLLPHLISLEQSGYVEGLQILDNIILSHEIDHTLKTTKTPSILINWTCPNLLTTLVGNTSGKSSWILVFIQSGLNGSIMDHGPHICFVFSPNRRCTLFFFSSLLWHHT